MTDLIDRRKALDAMLSAGTRDQAEWAVRILPSAQPERRKGKWVKGMNGHYKCSCCGLDTMILDDKSTFIDQFCRWCGADMSKESTSD